MSVRTETLGTPIVYAEMNMDSESPLSVRTETPIQKRHREIIKRDQFNKIFGFGLKQKDDLQDIIVKSRDQLRFDDLRSKSKLIDDLNKKTMIFNARIDMKKKRNCLLPEMGYALLQKATKHEVPEYLSDVMNMHNEINKKYQYLDNLSSRLDPNYEWRWSRDLSVYNSFVNAIPHSLLLYFGKTAFMRIVNDQDITEYFTKTGTIRAKFHNAPIRLREFIFRLIEQVKKK